MAENLLQPIGARALDQLRYAQALFRHFVQAIAAFRIAQGRHGGGAALICTATTQPLQAWDRRLATLSGIRTLSFGTRDKVAQP